MLKLTSRRTLSVLYAFFLLQFCKQYKASNQERKNEINEKQCRYIYRDDGGFFASPNYPDPYSTNLNCTYTIETTKDKQISLDVEDFLLETSKLCNFDKLSIFDGRDTFAPLLRTYCGLVSRETIFSSGNTITAVFLSDNDGAKRGFKINYKAVKRCFQEFSSSKGQITSLAYPQVYPHNIQCDYVVRVAEDQTVRISFKDFLLEDVLYENCFDFVQIAVYRESNWGPFGEIFCSNQPPKDFCVDSKKVLIRFTTDNVLNKSGFKAVYEIGETKCDGTKHKKRPKDPKSSSKKPHFSHIGTTAFSHASLASSSKTDERKVMKSSSKFTTTSSITTSQYLALTSSSLKELKTTIIGQTSTASRFSSLSRSLNEKAMTKSTAFPTSTFVYEKIKDSRYFASEIHGSSILDKSSAIVALKSKLLSTKSAKSDSQGRSSEYLSVKRLRTDLSIPSDSKYLHTIESSRTEIAQKTVQVTSQRDTRVGIKDKTTESLAKSKSVSLTPTYNTSSPSPSVQMPSKAKVVSQDFLTETSMPDLEDSSHVTTKIPFPSMINSSVQSHRLISSDSVSSTIAQPDFESYYDLSKMKSFESEVGNNQFVTEAGTSSSTIDLHLKLDSSSTKTSAINSSIKPSKTHMYELKSTIYPDSNIRLKASAIDIFPWSSTQPSEVPVLATASIIVSSEHLSSTQSIDKSMVKPKTQWTRLADISSPSLIEPSEGTHLAVQPSAFPGEQSVVSERSEDFRATEKEGGEHTPNTEITKGSTSAKSEIFSDSDQLSMSTAYIIPMVSESIENPLKTTMEDELDISTTTIARELKKTPVSLQFLMHTVPTTTEELDIQPSTYEIRKEGATTDSALDFESFQMTSAFKISSGFSQYRDVTIPATEATVEDESILETSSEMINLQATSALENMLTMGVSQSTNSTVDAGLNEEVTQSHVSGIIQLTNTSKIANAEYQTKSSSIDSDATHAPSEAVSIPSSTDDTVVLPNFVNSFISNDMEMYSTSVESISTNIQTGLISNVSKKKSSLQQQTLIQPTVYFSPISPPLETHKNLDLKLSKSNLFLTPTVDMITKLEPTLSIRDHFRSKDHHFTSVGFSSTNARVEGKSFKLKQVASSMHSQSIEKSLQILLKLRSEIHTHLPDKSHVDLNNKLESTSSKKIKMNVSPTFSSDVLEIQSNEYMHKSIVQTSSKKVHSSSLNNREEFNTMIKQGFIAESVQTTSSYRPPIATTSVVTTEPINECSNYFIPNIEKMEEPENVKEQVTKIQELQLRQIIAVMWPYNGFLGTIGIHHKGIVVETEDKRLWYNHVDEAEETILIVKLKSLHILDKNVKVVHSQKVEHMTLGSHVKAWGLKIGIYFDWCG
eukprot:gene6803-7571_t